MAFAKAETRGSVVRHAFEMSGASVSLGGKTLLHPADLTIKAGELVVIVGPNGAGKSTLMKLLTGDHAAASGQVRYDAEPLEKWPIAEMAARRAVMPQSDQLSFPFTVLEVVQLGARLFAANPREVKQRAIDALRKVDLAGYEGRFYQELSGGEQQRVQLARVLCQVWEPLADAIPRYLFLDEPTASLDIRHQLDIMTLARDFVARGGGCVAILHDLNLAAMFADRLLVISRGHIVADGPPGEILTDQLMLDVFAVPIRVSQLPSPTDIPFILPQSCIP